MDESSSNMLQALSLDDAADTQSTFEDMTEEGQRHGSYLLGQDLEDRDFAVGIFREEVAETEEEGEQPQSSTTPVFDSTENRYEDDDIFQTDHDMPLSDLEDLQTRSLAYRPALSERMALAVCVVCQDQTASEKLLKLECGHLYCETCVNDLFHHATNDESLFPPRCCGLAIQASGTKWFLHPEVLEKFEQKVVEYTTKNRTYCHDTTCGEFISPQSIEGEKAKCGKCGKETCTICKSPAHENDCPKDPAFESLMEVAQQHGYRSCYNCKRLVELNFGCNHIT